MILNTNPLLHCRQAEVTRLREELAALKVVPQQGHMDQKAPSLQSDDDNKSVNDIRQSVNDIRQSNVISKAGTLSSNHSSSSPHTTSAPPTPQVFLIGYIIVLSDIGISLTVQYSLCNIAV